MRLEHRSTSRAIGTTGLKSSNQALRNRGGIYRKYLGAISNSEQSKIASHEAQAQSVVAEASVPAKRYAKAIPVKRDAKTISSSKKSIGVKPVKPKPIRGRTEMASLLQRAFSGY